MPLWQTIKSANYLLHFNLKILPAIQTLWKGSSNKFTSQLNPHTTDSLEPREPNGNDTNQNKETHVKKFRDVEDQFIPSNNETNPKLTLNCILDKDLNKRIAGTIIVNAFLFVISALEAFQEAIVPTSVSSLSSLSQVLPLSNSKPESEIKKGNTRTRIEHMHSQYDCIVS